LISKDISFKGRDRENYIELVLKNGLSTIYNPSLLKLPIPKEIIEFKGMNVCECLENRDLIFKLNVLVLNVHTVWSNTGMFLDVFYGRTPVDENTGDRTPWEAFRRMYERIAEF